MLDDECLLPVIRIVISISRNPLNFSSSFSCYLLDYYIQVIAIYLQNLYIIAAEVYSITER